jgi:diacylglycerol kinase (ATP)
VRCVLIYNPVSGQNPIRRADQLNQTVNALKQLGFQAELIATTAPGSAIEQTRQAVLAGADVVFACGGDGTIHEVIQALISEKGEIVAALGIVPMGSANALARHLRLPLDPVQAALHQIRLAPKSLPVGKIKFSGQTRYFTVMAGAGPDGALVYNLPANNKSSLGRTAYYLRAARLFATRHFRTFNVEYTLAGTTAINSQRAVSAMTVRVGNLGGLFNRLVGQEASLADPNLTLLMLKAPAPLSLPLWFLSGWLNLHSLNPFLRSVQVSRFSCLPLGGQAPRFQADGEPLGRIPIEVSTVPNALRVLLPD